MVAYMCHIVPTNLITRLAHILLRHCPGQAYDDLVMSSGVIIQQIQALGCLNLTFEQYAIAM
jgi:hypothetical protein